MNGFVELGQGRNGLFISFRCPSLVCMYTIYLIVKFILSNQIKNTLKRCMSQANQRHIVAETRQSVHVHYMQCESTLESAEKLSGSTFIRQ